MGWRYVISRSGSGFSAFISASSTIGIALGVMVLIVVLSAMNGFEKVLTEKLLAIVPHVELDMADKPIDNWPESIKKLQQQPEVITAAPVIKITGMLQHGTKFKAVEIRAVEPQLETLVSSIDHYIVQGRWHALTEQNNVPVKRAGIIIGRGMAKKLELSVGDKVQLLLSENNKNHDLKTVFATPMSKSVEIVGIFKFGGTLDDTLAYMSLQQGQEMMGYSSNEVHSVRIKITDVLDAQVLARKIAYQFDHSVVINNWTQSQGHVYKDIQLVRLVMLIALVLVIAVASFNIVATLIMAVNDKKGDIAILKTMGASALVIMLTFIVQGLVNGVLGSLIGALLGIYIAENLTEVVTNIEQVFGVQFLSGDVYFIDYLPSSLHLSDVYTTVVTALVMSLLATIYPAWRATKIEPAQVLGQL